MASNEITATAIEHEADAVGQFEHLLGRLTHDGVHGAKREGRVVAPADPGAPRAQGCTGADPRARGG